ncbi:MAG: hypothetical protein J6D23_05625 [Clostridia bacterium]|nr:hypothetical protein [Clostridia bacterium]
MKKKIVSLSMLTVALILEIIPYGVRLKWADFYVERYTSHSYFSLIPWGYGDIGPFLCGILTIALMAMLTIALFIKEKKGYSLAIVIINLIAVIMSLIPTFFNSYTLIGFIITVLLAVSCEINLMIHINK